MTETEYQISYQVACYPYETTPMHCWTLTVDGEIASRLWVDMTTGEIMNVETEPAHQRNGYASALYRQAASEMPIYHAPATHRSYAGSRFAESVGGESLPCLHGCAACADDEDDE